MFQDWLHCAFVRQGSKNAEEASLESCLHAAACGARLQLGQNTIHRVGTPPTRGQGLATSTSIVTFCLSGRRTHIDVISLHDSSALPLSYEARDKRA